MLNVGSLRRLNVTIPLTPPELSVKPWYLISPVSNTGLSGKHCSRMRLAISMNLSSICLVVCCGADWA